jgi:hypothetical protein
VVALKKVVLLKEIAGGNLEASANALRAKNLAVAAEFSGVLWLDDATLLVMAACE